MQAPFIAKLCLFKALVRSLRAGTGAALVAFAAGMLATAQPLSAQGPPTAEEYAQHVGGAQIIPAGKYKLDGNAAVCGHRPVVLDPKLDDYGAAYPGFLIMNPRLLAKVSTPVKMWIFAHECGHQYRGPDEDTADCFAVQRGRRYGWLTEGGLDEICSFISPARGSSMHLSGSYRCESMRKCFRDNRVR
ncbi:MAG: hypothetical protein R3D27_06955 [Hyphomicrobiaceae bacterium]